MFIMVNYKIQINRKECSGKKKEESKNYHISQR